jgi:uncharacterized protein
MIDFPDLSAFGSVISDRRFLAVIGVAALSGAVRGFSGFGSALIYVPLISAIYEPRIAAATVLLIDLTCGLPYAIAALPRCNGREVAAITLAAAVTIPLGTLALRVVDPVILRWLIAALVLGLLVILASGWRYHGRPRLRVTVAVGLIAGLCSGAVQLPGPPAIIYWLGGKSEPAIVRANLMVYLAGIGGIALAVYLGQGLLTGEAVAMALLVGPPFIIAMMAGAHWFHGASDLLYRRIAYLIIAAAAITSVPVFDGLLR